MSNKNNKEKSSFWKKLVGKNKSSISSLKSEANLQYDKHDSVSIKSKKRQSGLFSHPPQPPPPQPQPQTQPPTPKPTIQQQQQQQSKGTMTTPTMATVDTLIPTPPIATADTKLKTDTKDNKDDKQTQPPAQQTNQAVKNDITPKKVTGSSSEEILNLKAELEKHKATILVLQKQKEAVAKDLDYLELTVEELLTEKNDLIQQLEDEKIKSQNHLEDLNMLLHKMKTTADNARDQSFAKDQTRQELENFQLKASEEKENLLVELKQKDKSIRELKSKLNKSQGQTEVLKETIEHLVKTHAEELARINEENEKKLNSLLNTPHGSPETEKHDVRSIPVPTTKRDEDHEPKEYDDLDDQLMKLTKEKEKLQSFYSKIPLSGGGPKSRRRKEELEAQLDQVDSQLSKVKQKIKRS